LSSDDFDVFVVNRLTLRSVNTLNFGHDVLLDRVDIRKIHEFSEVVMAGCECLTFLDHISIFHAECFASWNFVYFSHWAVTENGDAIFGDFRHFAFHFASDNCLIFFIFCERASVANTVTAPEDEPEDEDLDDDLEDEDEEDEEDELDDPLVAPPAAPEPAPAAQLEADLPPPGPRQRKVRGRRPPMPLPPLAAEARAAREEVASVMEKIDAPRDRVSCTLMRVKPALWKGKKIDGWLGRWAEPLSNEEINNEYGGGDYEWFIRGPDPRNPKVNVLLERRPVRIAGDPRLPRDADERPAEIELVREIVQRSQRDVEAARKEAEKAREDAAATTKRLQAESGSTMRDMLEVVTKLMNPQGALQQVEQRLTAAEEKRIRDEEKAEERRRKEEEARETRHREMMDAQEKRHQENLKAMQLAHEKDMARIQAETQRTVEAMRASENNGSKVTEMMLQLTQKMAAESEQRNLQFLSMMQNNAQAVAAATKAAEETKTEFLLKILTEKKDDPIESIVKMKKVMDLFGGGGEKGESVWREVMDGVREAAPGIVAALRSGPSAPAQAPAPSIAPGSVAAVDLPARRKKRRRLAAPATTRIRQLSPLAPDNCLVKA
jgi:hypothetical protein